MFPFKDYESAFKDCTGLEVEKTALICPSCIRKLNEAIGFRELSLRSDEILRAKQTEIVDIVIKSEPLDEDSYEADNVVPKEESEEEESIPEKPVVRKGRRKASTAPKKPKRQISIAHSIRAKTAWTQETKENLIKECPYCFFSGVSKPELMYHVQEHIVENGGLQCDHCQKRFLKKRQLKRHINRVFLGLKDGAPIGDALTLTLSCVECKQSFPRKSLLRIHYKEKHPYLLENKPQVAEPFTCKDCGKSLKTKKSLESHELTHTGLRPFICPVCGKRYKTKEGLRYHELTHTNQRPYVCNTCGKGFKTRENLRDHEPIHTGALDFECDVCQKRFRARNLLVGHRVIHDEVPKHSCNVCGLKFRRVNNLRDHKLSHTERRDFCCADCGTAFKSRSSLKRHMKQHAIKLGLGENCIELRNSSTAMTVFPGFRLEGFIVQTKPELDIGI